MERLSTEQLKTLDLRLLEWYYNQADTYHKDLVRVESSITDRGYTLLAVYFAILTACVGYVLTHLQVKDDVALTCGCLSITVFSSVAIYYVCRVIWPHTFFAPGKRPDLYSIPQYTAYFHSNGIASEEQMKRVLGDELVELQRKSQEQNRSNQERIGCIRHSILFLLSGVLIGILSFMIAVVTL